MPYEYWFYASTTLMSLSSVVLAFFATRKAFLVESFLNHDVLTGKFEKASEVILSSFETRMKGIEVEWETVYDKFDKLTKRRGGGLGGRPPKIPDSIPADGMVDDGNTRQSRRSAIAQRAKQRR